MKAALTHQSFPQQIEHYTFEKEFTESNPNSAYTFAIYSDGGGKKYFCKRWQGKKKDYTYQWICNEIEVYRCFQKLYAVSGAEIKKVFPEIKIPNLAASYIEEDTVLLLTEFMKGKKLEHESAQERAIVFSRILEYFAFISPLIAKQTHRIPHFSRLYLIALFHYYLLRSLFSFKMSVTKTFQILSTFYSGALSMMGQKDLHFVHRDLGFADNIIVSNNTIQIIDFQLSGLSNPMVEVANITMALWEDTQARRLFLKTPYVVHQLTQKSRKKQFHAFLAHAFLVSTNMQLASKEHIREYIISKFSPTALQL